MKKNTKWWRIITGALIGAIFSVIFLVFPYSFIINIFFKLVLSILIVLISFGYKNMFLRTIFIFYLISFIFGGICFSLNNNGFIVEKFNILKMCFYIFIGICFLKLLSCFMRFKKGKSDLICNINIGINGSVFQINVLIDTGNLLREPCTGKGVIIVEKSFINKVIGADYIDKILDTDNGYNNKFFIIPYSSLGNDSGVLLGIPCDFVSGVWEREFYLKNLVIGVHNGKISSSGRYSGILGAESIH